MTDLADGSVVNANQSSPQEMAKAAAAWEVAVLGAEQRQQWVRADRARLHWALCLHGLGRCDDAVAVLQQAWAGTSIGRRTGLVAAAILSLRLLGWCGRQDEAGVLWSAMEISTTPSMRRRALNELLSHANSGLNEEVGARTHGKVCGYRRRELLVPTPGGRAHG